MCCRRLINLLVLGAAVAGASSAQAQIGNTVGVPVAERRWEEKTQTTYRPQYTTEMRDTVRTYYTPKTQYHWEARWRPFSANGWVYEAVPTVVWQAHSETVRVPVMSQQYVAETKVVRQPYLALRFVEQQAPRRLAAAPQPAPQAGSSTWRSVSPTPAVSIARREQLGGIVQLESDPPRRGLQLLR